jgi:hypothetical protein
VRLGTVGRVVRIEWLGIRGFVILGMVVLFSVSFSFCFLFCIYLVLFVNSETVMVLGFVAGPSLIG